ncbi:protein stunted-like isoform X1 [Adelges cooleyi]|uniref:protein stunted-like isoform X1 n=1 Tax=Adelges cooleyi TaxID=133065 RepID=UPI0021801C47|nr:protein stunted-like isoform X1 [Adelges cooleyi]
MSYWRAAGLNYVNYSNIAAKVVRRVLKSDLQASASKRDESHVKFTPWNKGKPANEKA